MDNADQKETHRNYMWLLSIISVLSVVALIAIYHLIPTPFATEQSSAFTSFLSSLCDLIRNVIPNLVAAVVVFLAIYWILSNRGLVPSQLEREASEKRIIEQVLEAARGSTSGPSEIQHFYPAFQQVDWDHLIGMAQLRIDIVVNYFDSWVKDNRSLLIAFFKKPKTVLYLYLPDPNCGKVFDELSELYTDSSESVLREKIEKTEKRFLEAIQEAGGTKSQLKVYWLTVRPTYALQRFDSRLAVFSAYDNARTPGVASPAFVLDLHRAASVADYFERELKYLQTKQTPKPGSEKPEERKAGGDK